MPNFFLPVGWDCENVFRPDPSPSIKIVNLERDPWLVDSCTEAHQLRGLRGFNRWRDLIGYEEGSLGEAGDLVAAEYLAMPLYAPGSVSLREDSTRYCWVFVVDGRSDDSVRSMVKAILDISGDANALPPRFFLRLGRDEPATTCCFISSKFRGALSDSIVVCHPDRASFFRVALQVSSSSRCHKEIVQTAFWSRGGKTK